MIKTKHISLDDDCIKRVAPYVFKHGGNFSAAIREMIERAEDTPSERSLIIDEHLFDWLLNEMDGRLIPNSVLDVMMDKSLSGNMDNLNKFINKRLSKFGWKVSVNIGYDNVSSPSNMMIQVTGAPQRTRLIACMISQFIIKNLSNFNLYSPTSFAVKSVVNLDSETRVWLAKSVSKKDGTNSLTTFFGNLEEVAKAIKSRPLLWKCIINRHVESNYQMVTIHRNYYEDILSGKSPMGEIMIETIAKRSIKDIPLQEILQLIKKVYETSRIVDKVDIHDNTIILFHAYRNKDVIEKIKKQLIMLLETNGHTYDGEITTNMIVFTCRPDIGMKIDGIVNNLKSSESNLDQELVAFMTFLKDIDNMANASTSISILGKRIGTILMQEYEKENDIKILDLDTFKRAFVTIDSKIHIYGELELDKNGLLYRIRKCNTISENVTFGSYICRAATEAFKGAANYVFGNRADMEIKRSLSHGNDCCEVMIKIYDTHKENEER
jgi:predicted hydrocarbon binding protein